MSCREYSNVQLALSLLAVIGCEEEVDVGGRITILALAQEERFYEVFTPPKNTIIALNMEEICLITSG